jgi:hypothetical protein
VLSGQGVLSGPSPRATRLRRRGRPPAPAGLRRHAQILRRRPDQPRRHPH